MAQVIDVIPEPSGTDKLNSTIFEALESTSNQGYVILNTIIYTLLWVYYNFILAAESFLNITINHPRHFIKTETNNKIVLGYVICMFLIYACISKYILIHITRIVTARSKVD
jgi:hypothetical protein